MQKELGVVELQTGVWVDVNVPPLQFTPIQIVGATAVPPVPVPLSVEGPAETLPFTESVPLRAPAPPGVNVTPTLQVEPGVKTVPATQ